MPRAEFSQDIGELFRQKVGSILIPLKFDIIGEKYAFECKSKVFHKSQEHTIDLLARHLHAGRSAHKKTIVIESKKTFPSPKDTEDAVEELANKIECLNRKILYTFSDEGVVFTEDSLSIRQQESFQKASEEVAASRRFDIELVSGSKFRMIEALSSATKYYSTSYSVTTIGCSNKPDQDLGSICPMSIGENSRLYLCALKAGEVRLSVFKIDGENYIPDNFMEDMAWIKDYSGVLDEIHSVEGFTDKAIQDIKDSGLKIGIVDHHLQRCFNVQYLNYTAPP
jgi:hypothetical protein